MSVRKIAFIGPPGSGKSTLAKEYAETIGEKYIDTDEIFTARYGDIKAYFEAHGESAFRQKETELMIEAANSGAKIIALGGGGVLNSLGMNAIRARADIVLLTAPKCVLARRIERSNRPLKGELNRLLSERDALYKKYADYTVDTEKDGLNNIISALKAPRGNRFDILLCDSDDTILDFQAGMRFSVIKAMRALGVTAADDTIVSCFREITDEVWSKLERGEITRSELKIKRFEMLGGRLCEKLDPLRANELFMEYMLLTRFVLDGALEFLDEVRRRGIKAYIITNSFLHIANERLKALDGHIDGAFVSEKIGFDKPDARFFDAVFKEIGDVPHCRILVLGDSESSDIRGGKNCGLTTCLFDPSGAKKTSADFVAHSYKEAAQLL